MFCLVAHIVAFKICTLFITSFYFTIQKLYTTTMTEFENVSDLKAEIQRLLGEIHKDMSKLKSEVSSLQHILEKDASLPTNAKLVNERLMVAAKEAGIDLDDVEVETSDEETPEQNASEHNAFEDNTFEEDKSERENVTQESTRNDESTASTSNAASIAAATDKLKKKVKHTLG